MTRRAAIAAIAVAFAAFSQARGEWVTEVVTNVVAEYNGVEYLQSSGSGSGSSSGQYINTGLKSNVRYCTEIDILPMNAGVVLGCWSSGANPRVYYMRTFNSMEICITYYNSYIQSSVGSTVLNVRSLYRTEFTSSNLKLYRDGILKLSTSMSEPLSNSYDLWLFASNSTSTKENIAAKLYSCKVSNNGVVVRNFIPVVHNGAGKLLDLEHNTLYSNAGTGAFTYGAVTGKVAYVTITTNRVYRAPAPMRSFDAAHPFNAPTARTRLGGTGSGEDGTTLRPSAHFDIKKNEED